MKGQATCSATTRRLLIPQDDAGPSPLAGIRRLYSFQGEGRTLVHANATTLLVVLLLFFSDRLQGFATFLVVGILASLSTLVLTRSLLQGAARRGLLEARPAGPIERLGRLRPRLFRFRKIYFALLTLFLVGSALSFQQRGFWLPLGAELRPGMQIGLVLPQGGDPDTLVRDLEQKLDGASARIQSWTPEVLEPGGEAYLLSLSGVGWEPDAWTTDPESAEPDAPGPARVLETHGARILEMHSVDAQLSSRRVFGSLSVLLGSVLLLGLYLTRVQPRLDAWGTGAPTAVSPTLRRRILVATVGAVALDLAVALGALGWTERPLDMAVVAALLALVGYSVNDSMVLWSRLSRPGLSWPGLGRLTEAVIETEVDAVLSRAVLTSLSTMVPAATILLIGPQPLAGFAWIVLVGTAAGTLSSLFVVARAALVATD